MKLEVNGERCDMLFYRVKHLKIVFQIVLGGVRERELGSALGTWM